MDRSIDGAGGSLLIGIVVVMTPTMAMACPQQKQSSSQVAQSCFSCGVLSVFSTEAVSEVAREASPAEAAYASIPSTPQQQDGGGKMMSATAKNSRQAANSRKRLALVFA